MMVEWSFAMQDDEASKDVLGRLLVVEIQIAPSGSNPDRSIHRQGSNLDRRCSDGVRFWGKADIRSLMTNVPF